jgi:hypothetical protein
VRILHPDERGGLGHELHQALRALPGDRGVIEVGFHRDHRHDQLLGQAVALGRRLDVVGDGREVVPGRLDRLDRSRRRLGPRGDGLLDDVGIGPRRSHEDERRQGERGAE